MKDVNWCMHQLLQVSDFVRPSITVHTRLPGKCPHLTKQYNPMNIEANQLSTDTIIDTCHKICTIDHDYMT